MSIDEQIITLVADTVRKTLAETSNGHAETVELLTIAEAAHALKVHKDTLYTWIKEKQITPVDFGTDERPNYRIHPAELERFIRDHERETG